ncbi:hypothetical protein F1188_12835 [Roseospira marina]|uniref:Carbohydrate kinase PfkB domain-containing protein n=1 Tax=Roseospira marina TaxID=140057 RepID=A0A5M6IB20_9PROT|nr:PfkB family carbohydrate kinase [Roseospira marina]KAA5605157.1 hypothetical protein F1188_12835 [Roseospira marina]MBB4314914.1 sugar/nucleoside kinase (ribokinase family) [Roseospira marina]MBB5087914.1 sugar/nucleoside kinase (ribokinase family) [Roseospira marina]
MARFWVIGNLNADEVVHVDAPPRPGGHLTGRAAGLRLGGGGANMAVALVRAGHAVRLFASVGDDAAGARLVSECQDHGVDVRGVHQLAGRTTSQPLILIDPSGERTLIARRTLTAADLVVPTDEGTAEGLVVKTFHPGLAPMMAVIASRGLVVAHAPPPTMVAWPATVWVTSEREITAVVPDAPWASARERAGPALRWVVVTRGASGAEAFGPDGVTLNVPAVPPGRVVDTTGAGDVFAAGLLHGLLPSGGADIAHGLSIATRWATRTIQTEGSIPPRDLCADG